MRSKETTFSAAERMSGFLDDSLTSAAASTTTTTTTTTTTNAQEDLAAQIAALKLQNEQLKKKANKKTNKDSDSGSDSSSSSSSSSSDSSDSDSADSEESDSDTNDTKDNAKVKSDSTKSNTKVGGGSSNFAEDTADEDFFDQLSSDAPKEEVQVEGHEYHINLPRHTFGPGIVWETDWGGKQAAVKSFKRLQDGQHGPAANSGLIEIGHILIAVNGKRIIGKTFEEQVKYVERASKKNKGKGEYVLTMCDPTRTKSTTKKGKSSIDSSSGSGGDSSSSSNASLDSVKMNQALKEVHRNKLKYYQAVPAQEMTCCFLERYRGDHITSFHMHRQIDSAFVMAASMPCAMKGDVVFHTLQDMTWEATMKDISTGEILRFL